MNARMILIAASGVAALLGAPESALAGTTTITFDNIAAPGGFVAYGNGPLTLSGATFTSNGDMFIIDPGYYGSSYPNGGFLNSDYAGPTDTITVTLPGGVYSGSFDIGGLFAGTTDFTVTFNGSTFPETVTESINGTDSLAGFLFSSSAQIATITFVLPDAPGYNALDNFSYTTVPEPATWAMMLLGFAGLGFAGYRKAKSGAAIA
jgi:hypothetical protein